MLFKVKYAKYTAWGCLSVLLIALAIAVASYLFANSPDELKYSYGVPIKINNSSGSDLVAVLFPIQVSSAHSLKQSVEQVNIKKNESEVVQFYLGKKQNLPASVAVGVAVWKIDPQKTKPTLQGPPYTVRILSNPGFEIGPERYGVFAEVNID